MIEVKNICKEIFSTSGLKRYELKNISFPIEPGKITSVIGAAGSGKSTLLKIICSLELPTSGEIKKELNDKIVYLPSKPSSFPWLTVYDNVSFGIKNKADSEIKRLIRLVGLDGYEKFYPNNKSFGFRFRVSVARSLAHKPALILLDDLFRLMDSITKEEIYSLLQEINQKEKTTFLLATSSISEALILSDYVYLLNSDRVENVLDQRLDNLNENKIDYQKNDAIRQHIKNILCKLNPDELSKISL
jgi:ABC-type nitrate/sulfonate/bicarbonate transport system ATPase subunit